MFNLSRNNREHLNITFMVYIYFLVILILAVFIIDPSRELIADDKLIHFGTFSLFSFILYLALSIQNKNMLLKEYPALFSAAFASFFGLAIELYQLFIPSRSSDIFDLTANIFGSLFTIVIIKFMNKLFKKLKRISF